MKKICLAASLVLLYIIPCWARPSHTTLAAQGEARRLLSLDVGSEAPSETVQEIVIVKYGDLAEVRSLLATLVPDIEMTILGDEPGHLLLEGTAVAIEQAKELLDQLDQPLDQIVLECKLAELSDSQVQALSVNWSSDRWEGRLCEAVGPTEDGPSLPCPLQSGLYFRISPGLAFLVTSSDTRVLASPRVAFENGAEGEIHVGDKFPLVKYNRQSGDFNTAYQDIGLKLMSKCTLGADGKIRCHIAGKYSLLKELLAEEHPLVQTVFFERDIEMNDGQSLIISGLATPEQLRSAAQSVPLLRDLPIQGGLFRNFRPGNQLYLMITPNIMK